MRGLPYLEDEAVSRYGLRSQQQPPELEQFSFDRIISNMKHLIDDFILKIQKRLLGDLEENRLSESTALLTNLSLFKPLAAQYGPQPFAPRVLQQFSILEACRHTTYLEDDVTNDALTSQIRTFFVRLHPFFESVTLDIRVVLKEFFSKPDLYDSIPDFLQCIAITFLIKHNESYIESLESV
jgi:hypothetical protein